jgi:hypothetical protein
VRAARARVDAAAFAACEKAVREAPCERVLRIFADVSVPLPYLENDACRDLYDGGSADGEPCCADEECAGGACARESAASGADGGARVSRCAKAQIRPGTVRTAAEGQACDPTGEPMCPAAQTCLRKPEGGRACAAWRARAADEPCQDSTDCAAPLVCGPQYRCAPKAGEGASCCPEGESCSPAFCRDDLRCDFEARACAPRLPSGAACPELVERACAEGFVCRAGRCAAPAASLAECRSHGECAAGWACAGGRCAPRGEAGAACADDPECREGLVCNPFSPRVCVPPSAPLLCESG